MKISQKLPLAVGAALAMALAAGLFGIHQLNGSIAAFVEIASVDYAHERKASQMLSDFKTQVQEWKNTLLRGKDPKQLDKYWVAFQKQERAVADTAHALQAAMRPGEARDLVARFAEAHAEMGKSYRNGFEAYKASGLDSAAG